ncbi:MAG: spore maturation protein [Clostridia bacterium]|nr:spore maturation protein [Clostridia bacterium]
MTVISTLSVPLLIALFVGLGLLRRVGVYDCFVEGAKDGLQSMVGIIAPLIGLMVAINMFRASGALELLGNLLTPVLDFLKLPADVLPLALLRPVSGSASTAIVTDIFQNLGPDSPAGKIASVMMGSTETTFYTVAVYFGAVGIKNSRHTLPAALAADATGILLSILVAHWMLL